MLYEDVKLICKVMCGLVGVGEMLYSSTMLEFDHDDGIHF